jgi:ferric-chelate reductase (NADPH)
MSRLKELVADTVSKRLFRSMRVTQVSERGPFREIGLTAVASWTPGDKIQLRVARDGLTMRTYTPVRWDETTGDTTILSYLHGAGPGSVWAQNVAADDSVQVVGPRRSIDLTRFTSAPIFVGDETSVGLRVAWTAAHPDLHPVRDIFELGADSPTALRAFGLEPMLVTRDETDDHLPVLVEQVVATAAEHHESPLILTGRSTTIAAIRGALKAAGHAQRRTRVRTYWDPRRTGLD